LGATGGRRQDERREGGLLAKGGDCRPSGG